MKTLQNCTASFSFSAFLYLAAFLLLSSCYKEPLLDPAIYAEVNVVHLNSSIQMIDATIADEKPFAHGLGHYEQTGYKKVATGFQELLLIQSAQQTILKREERKFQEDERLTLLFFSQNGGTRSIWMEDLKNPSSESAHIRLINMVDHDGPVPFEYKLVSQDDTPLSSDNPNTHNDFISVTPQPSIFKIVQSDNAEKFINTNSLNLVGGHQYTIIVEGDGEELSTFVWEH